MELRPVLVVPDDSRSDDPDLVLDPYHVGGTGYRLWKMVQSIAPLFSQRDFQKRFDRRVLSRFPAPSDIDSLQVCWSRLRPELGSGKTVVLFGVQVRDAARLSKVKSLTPIMLGGLKLVWVPGLSMKNRWYNVKKNRETVAALLFGEVRRA